MTSTPRESLLKILSQSSSIGDHLHPDGKMETQTYRNIGYAYDYSEKIAPYCFGGEPTANLGVYISGNRAADEGLSNILIENQLDYEVVANHNFADFDTVIFSAPEPEYSLALSKSHAFVTVGSPSARSFFTRSKSSCVCNPPG